MAVTNVAQVDAQFPFPTANNQPGGLYGGTEKTSYQLLHYYKDRTLVSETERGVQHLLEVKRRGGRNRHIQSEPWVLVTVSRESDRINLFKPRNAEKWGHCDHL